MEMFIKTVLSLLTVARVDWCLEFVRCEVLLHGCAIVSYS